MTDTQYTMLWSLPPILAHLLFCRGLHENEIRSTKDYVRIYQRIMQNKPNFQDTQMNVNLYNATDYENKRNRTLGQNKPNQSQLKPICRKGKIDAKCVFTKDYRKKDDFIVRINKPNFVKGPKCT